MRYAAPIVAALALAAPAAADSGATALYPETVAGAGLSGVAGAEHTIVRSAAGHGLAGGVAFRLTTTEVAYGGFRSTLVRSVSFGLNTVTVRGVGLVHGRRVSFVARGVHNLTAEVDAFHIQWNHGATHGGKVTSGSVWIV